MRKHDVRKWLHAILDLLPVILIPVFMIYSHRHTIDSGSISVPQNLAVDFNQLNNPISSTEFLNVSIETNDYEYTFNGTSEGSGGRLNNLSQNLIQIYNAHKYYIKYVGTSNIVEFGLYLSNVVGYESLYVYAPNSIYTSTLDAQVILGVNFANEQVFDNDNCYISLFDLTQMFGSGNEPTTQQFDSWYTDDYYEFTLSRKELLKDVSTITFDDTDIMSQVVYQLYNSVDKYFNMDNVFNMTGVYDWFNLNIFHGNAPISIYIVWNIVLYEFVMDLLFLLYGLFMWFIDMVEKLMEKPLKSVK